MKFHNRTRASWRNELEVVQPCIMDGTPLGPPSLFGRLIHQNRTGNQDEWIGFTKDIQPADEEAELWWLEQAILTAGGR